MDADAWDSITQGKRLEVKPVVERLDDKVIIHADAKDDAGKLMHYKTLNELIRREIEAGTKHIILQGVMGQRYIASTVKNKDLYIEIHGTPGNNLGAFLDGATIEVFGNAQDMTGNTMNSGRIIIHGNAWDVTGLAARGGSILIKGHTGYRVGIHMKEYQGIRPCIVIGETAKDYLGEYMAGGVIVVLNFSGKAHSPVGQQIGAGIHGGKIFVRGRVEEHQLGPGANLSSLKEDDIPELFSYIEQFEKAFHLDAPKDWEEYVKITPTSSRPFHGHYDPTPI
ncbi:MAG: hypothetical protein QW520_03150 [Methanomassiliicoccales archaeon]